MDNFWYDLIKDYYKLGLYEDADLDPFVQIGYITEEQKVEIIASKAITSKAS